MVSNAHVHQVTVSTAELRRFAPQDKGNVGSRNNKIFQMAVCSYLRSTEPLA